MKREGNGTNSAGNPVSAELETLNFKVPVAFKRSFKSYAATQGLTMLDLLREGFQLSKQKRGDS